MKTRWDLSVDPGNVYHVPQRLWKAWPNAARELFNATMEDLDGYISITDPTCLRMAQEDWYLVRWNAAVLAAHRLAKMLKVERKNAT